VPSTVKDLPLECGYIAFLDAVIPRARVGAGNLLFGGDIEQQVPRAKIARGMTV